MATKSRRQKVICWVRTEGKSTGTGDRVLAGSRRVICALAVALIVPLALGGCGRKGALDPPPSAATPPSPALQPQPPSTTGLIDPLTPTGQAQQAPPPVQTTQAAPAPQRKSFLLDPLIQ